MSPLYCINHSLTSQQSRSVGTQQLCRSRPAHQGLSTASWWHQLAQWASCLLQWNLTGSAASVHPPVVSMHTEQRSISTGTVLINTIFNIYSSILCQWEWTLQVNHVWCVIWDLCSSRAEINAQHLHASDDSQGRLQDVAKDDCSELHLFLFCVTTLMQNPVHGVKWVLVQGRACQTLILC